MASRCNGTIAAITVTDVFVPRGASCILNGTRVRGNVQAKRRTVVSVENSTIRGNLPVEECGAALVAADSRVGGDVQVEKADRATLTRVRLPGDVQRGENGGAVRAELLQVEGNMQVKKNRGGVLLLTNRIRQVLECKENAPAPTGSGNVAGEKLEQCRAL